jgi:ABC-type transport system involved in multi-copper enzyme maturation permease subunit
MTAYAIPAPRLVGADLLKLRKRRSLTAVVALLTVGAVVLTFVVMELMHVSNPAKHGPAGGVETLGHVTFLIAALGAVAAALVGATIGAGDQDAGVYRELVVTGRSRVALFLSRIPAGLAYLLPFVAAAYAIAAVVSVALAGSKPSPSSSLMIEGGLWALLQTAFYFLVAVGIATLLGSRSQTIGIVLAWRLALTPILASISALGVVRELVPGVVLQSLDPAGFGDALRQGPHVGVSAAAVAAVLIVWTVVALAAGAWRDTTRDA